MTVCPVAIAVGCKRCPAVSVCPLKETLGDYKPAEEAELKTQSEQSEKNQP